MQDNNNMNFLGFKDVIFDSFVEDNDFVYIHTSVKKMDTCPHCGSKRIWVHDHRIQKIKDTHIHGKKCLIHLKKTRYDCKSCGCRFERELDFIAKGHTMTNRLVFAIVAEFNELHSSTSIAKRYNISPNTVLKILSCLSVSRTELSKVLCIDTHRAQVNSKEIVEVLSIRLLFLMVISTLSLIFYLIGIRTFCLTTLKKFLTRRDKKLSFL
ncbi:transposase family protein [Peptoniphilus grossensis]|uniref:transposase family protein n=1 Tax=Peptoniphilus grossensis TaxID=1465756 RepID=UPI00399B0AF3